MQKQRNTKMNKLRNREIEKSKNTRIQKLKTGKQIYCNILVNIFLTRKKQFS